MAPRSSEPVDVTEDLAKLNEILEANPLEGYNSAQLNAIMTALCKQPVLVDGKKKRLKFNPKPIHRKQWALHSVQGHGIKRVYLGGNRGGKTTGGVIDDLIQALPEELVPPHLKKFKHWDPPFTCRIVTPDFTRTMAAVYEAIRKWCPKAGLQGGSWEKAFDKQNRVLYLTGGSFFEFMTYEQDLDKFGGTARHRIHYDEEPPGEKGEAVRTECRFRLADYNGDELFTFTPLLGLTWTFDEFWENKGPEIQKDVWHDEDRKLLVIRSDMDDNPHISEAGKEAALAGLPDSVRAARKGGNFAHFKGLVYDEFNPEAHVVPKPNNKHLASQDVLVGIDPGVRTSGVVFCAFDRENSMLVFDELYLHDEDAIPENAAQLIRAKLKEWGVKDARFVIDPASRNREQATGARVMTNYAKAGIFAEPGVNDVEAGVFEIKRRLESKPPGLFVAENCEKWRWEVGRYRKDEKTDGTFAVVKRDDHLLDPTRYVAMARLWNAPSSSSKPKRQGYTPNFQRPYKDEVVPQEAPPMGVYS